MVRYNETPPVALKPEKNGLVDPGERFADGLSPSSTFQLGWIFLAVATSLVLGVVVFKFGSGDRLVPILFLTAEAAICGCALWRLKLESSHLAVTLGDEPDCMTKLGQNGAHLADSLVHMGDRRRDSTEEFQELTATWANLLIITGMVGTAGYLVAHAGDFLMQGSELQTALKKLLPLAPKAFCATGLALACAAILGMVGTRVLRVVESHGPVSDRLIEAWRQGARSPDRQDSEESESLARAIASAFNEKVLGGLSELPGMLSNVVTSTTAAVNDMRSTIEGLTERMAELAGHFSMVAADSQAYLGQSREVMQTLVGLGTEATNLLERLKRTEAGLSESTQKSIAEMQRVLETYERKLMDHAALQAPPLVQAALSPTVEAFRLTMQETGKETSDSIRSLATQSFGEAHRVFNEAVSSTSARVDGLRNAIASIDHIVGLLDTKLRDASTQWAMPASLIEQTLSSLRAELERFAQSGAQAPGSVRSVAAALEEASQRIGESAAALVNQVGVRESQARLIGELEGTLGFRG